MISNKHYLTLIYTVFFLAIIVVGLGAFTRLTEAGLGCPDWPGCYGYLTVPQTPKEIASANQAFPQSPVETDKAWYEMIHRYVAGTLGILIACIAFLAWRTPERNRLLPSLLLLVVTFQAILGMWTVTMSLMPIVVMAHLLGGFTTVTLLFLLAFFETKRLSRPVSDLLAPLGRIVKPLSLVCLLALGVQIALGGWTSANYAALVCTKLPICEVNWQDSFDLRAFDLISPPNETYQFGVLNFEQRVTIHATHRIGAMLVSALLLGLTFLIIRPLGWLTSLGLNSLLGLQVTLGITNVVAYLPLSVAVAHNLVGLFLFLFVCWIVARLWRTDSSIRV